MPLTRREAMVVTAFTGVTTVNFGDFQRFVEQTLGRPVWTHELGRESVWDELKEATRDEFLAICEAIPSEPEDWEFEGREFTFEDEVRAAASMVANLPKDVPVVVLSTEDVERDPEAVAGAAKEYNDGSSLFGQPEDMPGGQS